MGRAIGADGDRSSARLQTGLPARAYAGGLSIIKSALIIGYFMHLKFERALMRWLLVISVSACFVIMYFFFFPDADRILNLGVK